MKILIIEDEKLAADHLISVLNKCNREVQPTAVITSVEEAVNWFHQGNMVDLVFMDIQLEDGLSFEIFDQVDIKTPVIFTTAYNQYAIKAFKVNSVDYLLKPVDATELQKAFDKYDELYVSKQSQPLASQQAIEQIKSLFAPQFKTRFLVKIGVHIRSVLVDQIAFFYVREKSVFLTTFEGKEYALDQSLDQLEAVVDPQLFFRINRAFLINIQTIQDMIAFSSNRLKIVPSLKFDDEIIVSRDKVRGLKMWLDR